MQAFKVQTVVTPDGITIKNLPFKSGDRVEVIILAQPAATRTSDPYPLRGTVLRYDDPTAPVAENDWEATQ